MKRGFYRHYKGGLYFVLGTGQHSETKEELVVYYTLHFYQFWARPVAIWHDIVEVPAKYYDQDFVALPPGVFKSFLAPRFQKISAWQAFKLWFKKPKIS